MTNHCREQHARETGQIDTQATDAPTRSLASTLLPWSEMLLLLPLLVLVLL
ncbi:hypothetical protein [Celeribacter sp.]|uniref:hypothetical protein n=1 Tax=Celeribacter sp. TaxID=1890673 RepID=UPI003A941387